jgi:hypothetical protein
MEISITTHIRAELPGKLEGFPPVCRFTRHLNIGLTGHQTDKAFAHDLMVVGKQQTLPSLKTEPASFLSISASAKAY